MVRLAPDRFQEFAVFQNWLVGKVSWRKKTQGSDDRGKCKEPQYFLYYHQQNLPTSLNAKGICRLNFPPEHWAGLQQQPCPKRR